MLNKLIFFSGFPVVNDPLYNHIVFGPEKGKGGRIGKSDEQLIQVRHFSKGVFTFNVDIIFELFDPSLPLRRQFI